MSITLNLFIVLVTTLVSRSQAHSWVEELTNLADDGSFTGTTGYPRGMVQRTVPGFTDTDMQWQLPSEQENALTANMTICKPSQQTLNYTQDSPMLTASAGGMIALRYQENGHVTLPYIKAGKPEHSGGVYVYGTTEPRANDTLLSIHKVWTLDGTGGDGRGRLLTSQYFDDGQCYQINTGPMSTARQKEFPRVAEAGSIQGADLWCQTDMKLPDDLQQGTNYTLYWVWDWPTMDNNGTVSLPELYTTCMDVGIGAGSNESASDHAAINSGAASGTAGSVPFVSITNYGEAAIETLFNHLAASPTISTSLPPLPPSSSPTTSVAATATATESTSMPAGSATQSPSPASTVTTTITTTETVTATAEDNKTVTTTVSTEVTKVVTDTVTTTMVVVQTSPTPSTRGPNVSARRKILAAKA